jgi:propanol-preferring alcohol dehydrogenase
VKLDDKMDMDASATLSCSALTAYGAVKSAELKPNDTAIVMGEEAWS